MTSVAALYIDPSGPYPKLLGPEMCWDETRDARNYAGPWPVVAHPPCGPWSVMKHLHRHPEQKEIAPFAVEQVRRWGGALEHPAGSGLFMAIGLPMPGELPDGFGGRTIEVEQVRWGHVARKATWVYLVRTCAPGRDPPPMEATHWVSGGRNPNRKGSGGLVPPGIKVCSAQQRRRTPIAFAEWLISLAATATPYPKEQQ